MKKILVTGGAGFIGLNLINHIINNTNHSVLNIDKLTYAANSNILNSLKFEDSNRYLFKKIDICDFERLNKIFSVFRPDIVMHLAAESHVDKSIKSPADFIKTNILGTYNLLEVSRQYLLDSGHNSFKFHHISTDEVFGDLPHPDFFKGEELPAFLETSSYKPSSPYSASKASSDHLVRAWHRTFDLPTIITNCSNNYGPFQFPEKLIPKTILNALNNKEIPVYGNGCQIRDWLYVDDHVKALINVALSDKVGTTYNIGGNSEKRNIEVVELICAILDQLKPRKISYKSLISFVEDRPGHDLRYSINSDKINQELGWSPKESFESGIRKTVEWYISNY